MQLSWRQYRYLVPCSLLLFFCLIVPVALIGKMSLFDGGFTAKFLASVFQQDFYLAIMGRTFLTAGIVAFACVVVGYPIAYFVATLPKSSRTIWVMLIVIPMWISVLVRTYAWMVVLGREGLINSVLMSLRVVDSPLQLLFTGGAVYAAMVQILLPISILASYGAILRIDPTMERAARLLGAGPFKAFATVTLPLSLESTLIGGGLLVFILALGFFITPALVGGPNDQLISNVITIEVTQTLDWNRAAALGVILVCFTLVFIAAYIAFVKLICPRR